MGKTYNNNEINDGHVHDLLSAYIDKSMEEVERVRVLAHLEECADCRADYVELQATQRMLRQMPAVSVPRAFTLTPEMAKSAGKTSIWERLFAPRTAPTFASGAVVAFGLLIFLAITSTFSTPSATGPVTTAYYQPTNQDTLRSSATSDPSASTGAAGIMAEPTTPTESAEAPTGAASKQSATPPNDVESNAAGSGSGDTAIQPPAPAGGQGSEAQPTPLITPDTDIASSGNSSPTTVALSTDTQTTEQTTQNTAGSAADNTYANTQPTAEQAPIAQTFDLFLAVEIGLLVLGLALGGAYLIARRN